MRVGVFQRAASGLGLSIAVWLLSLCVDVFQRAASGLGLSIAVLALSLPCMWACFSGPPPGWV